MQRELSAEEMDAYLGDQRAQGAPIPQDVSEELARVFSKQPKHANATPGALASVVLAAAAIIGAAWYMGGRRA